MHLLRQSTTATVLVGPVLDSTGAAVTSAVVGDFRLAKEGSTAILSGATVTHDANGYYRIALTVGNTDTVGRLAIYSNNTAQSMGTTRFTVLLPSVYDALIANATNTTGGLPTATAGISAFAGAISTLTAAGVRTELATELSRMDQTVSSRASQTSVNAIPTNPLLTNDTRLNNLDFAISVVNTNILNINNLSAKMNLFGAPLLEIPESGSTVYAFTLVVKDDEDKLVALDASPTVTAANAAGTNRSGNLSAVSNPSTGRYTFTYSVANTHAGESLRIAVSGAVSAEARYVEWIGAVVNYDSLTVLQQISSDLAGKPTLLQIEQSTILAKETTVNSRASQTSVNALPTATQNRDAVMNAMPNGGWVEGSFGDRWLIGTNNNREVQVTGSNHVSADVHAFQPAVIDAAAIADNAIDAASIAAGALNGKGDWLTTLGANAPVNWINAAAIATDAIDADAIATSAVGKITVNLFKYGDVQLWTSPANQIQVTITKV